MRTAAIVMNCHAESDPVVSIYFLKRFVVIIHIIPSVYAKLYSCCARKFTHHQHRIFINILDTCIYMQVCMHVLGLSLEGPNTNVTFNFLMTPNSCLP